MTSFSKHTSFGPKYHEIRDSCGRTLNQACHGQVEGSCGGTGEADLELSRGPAVPHVHKEPRARRHCGPALEFIMGRRPSDAAVPEDSDQEAREQVVRVATRTLPVS